MSREKIIDVMSEGWDLRPVSIEQRCRGLLTALEAAGYAIVPVEPTQAMMDALEAQWDWTEGYRAMIQSAKGE